MIDEKTRHMRALVVVVGASCSILETDETRTTYGAEIIVGTTKGDPCTYVANFGEPNLPTC